MLGQEISFTHLHVQFGSDCHVVSRGLLSSVAMTTPVSANARCLARCVKVEEDLDNAPAEGYIYVRRFLPEEEGGQSSTWYAYTFRALGLYRRVLTCGSNRVLKINLARRNVHKTLNANETEVTNVLKSPHLVIGYAIEARIGYT